MVSIAVIGPGLVGREHIKRILNHSRAELTAVVSPSHVDGESEFPTGDKTQIFDSVAELVDSGMSFDGVMICSPTQNHFEHLMALRNITEYLFVEKPILSSIEDIENCRSILSPEEQAKILVGHHRRHSSYFNLLGEIIASGQLGQIRCYSGHICFYKPDEYFSQAPWRLQPGGGPTFINLIHEIDLTRKNFGPVTAVNAFMTGGEPSQSAVENTCVVNFHHKSGILGSFVVSDRVSSTMNWERTTGENNAFPHDDGDYLFIFGSKGSLSFPSFKFVCGERLSWTADIRSASLVSMPVKVADPLAVQMDHFVSLCEGACAAPVISMEDGIANQLVCEAIKSSAAQGRLVTLDDE